MEQENQEMEVFINGVPDLKLVPPEIADSVLSVLEQQIVDWVNQKEE